MGPQGVALVTPCVHYSPTRGYTRERAEGEGPWVCQCGYRGVVIDWKQVASSKVFAFIKVTEGASLAD